VNSPGRCLAALLAALLLTGCASKSGSASSAGNGFDTLSPANRELAHGTLCACEIRGQKVETIRDTVESVYTENGFKAGKHEPNLLIFERPASRGMVAAYGSWGGIEVNIRLKVEITPQNRDVHLLRCRSYVVREPGSMAEGEQPLARRKVREYEGLLQEVASRLN